jgi:DNA replication and repair protein RecF
MKLSVLKTLNFRNLEPLSLDISGQYVVFSGQNGQGKTNSLEAVHLLGTLKPLRGRRIRDLIEWNEKQCRVSGEIHTSLGSSQYGVMLGPEGRTETIDGNKPESMEEYFSDVRVVAFTPYHLTTVSGEPGKRRSWLDRAVFTASPVHLHVVRTFKRILAQKSAALRSDKVDPMVLSVLNEKLVLAGAKLAERRAEMLSELTIYMNEVFGKMSAKQAHLNCRYKSHAEGETLQEREDNLRTRLTIVSESERQRRTTLAGPQMDDIQIFLDTHSARDFGSRGQIRSIVIAMKVAEFMAAKKRGTTPIFILDDVDSELDDQRMKTLLSILGELDAQVFLSTTDRSRFGYLPEKDTQNFSVQAGSVRER